MHRVHLYGENKVYYFTDSPKLQALLSLKCLKRLRAPLKSFGLMSLLIIKS